MHGAAAQAFLELADEAFWRSIERERSRCNDATQHQRSPRRQAERLQAHPIESGDQPLAVVGAGADEAGVADGKAGGGHRGSPSPT